METNYVEQYLITVYEMSTQSSNYILIPNNKAFSRLLSNLDSNLYLIMSVTPLGNVINYNEFIKKITIKNKPDNLEFGDLNK